MELQAPQSFRLKSGDTMRLEFTVVDENGNAADITGMTPRFVAARRAGATAALTSTGGTPNATAVVTDGPAGTIRVEATDAITDALSGTYAYECELEDGSGDSETIAHGYLTFDRNLL